jgi:hypothetical protein
MEWMMEDNRSMGELKISWDGEGEAVNESPFQKWNKIDFPRLKMSHPLVYVATQNELLQQQKVLFQDLLAKLGDDNSLITDDLPRLLGEMAHMHQGTRLD